MDNIDRLLSSIKAEQEQKRPSSPPPVPAEPQPSSLPASSPQSIDDLLQQIHGEAPPFDMGKPMDTGKPTSSDRLTTLKNTLATPSPAASGSAVPTPPVSKLTSAPLPVLQDLKAEFQEQQRQAEREQQRQEAARQREAERQERERQAALEKERLAQEQAARAKELQRQRQAEDWIKKLDPLAGEGIWFEEFASHYQSRLEAAIAYLNLE